MAYYKYRNFNNIEYFFDIISNKRLYCSLASELNDPFEWYFKSDDILSLEEQEKINNYKKRSYICSLSRTFANNVMWAMYADEHRGCCIEIELESPNDIEIVKVQYQQGIHFAEKSKSIKDIIQYKTSEWSYEDEERVLKKSVERPYVKVKITRVLLGLKVSNADVWEKIIHAFDPEIKVRRITMEEIENKKLNS